MDPKLQNLLAAVYASPVQIQSSRSIGGGCINQTLALTLSNGETVFLKQNDRPPEGMFEKEARGLNLMRTAESGPRIPKVLGLPDDPNPNFLLIEYIQEGAPGNGYYERFGQALAEMHRVTEARYGLDHDNFIGSTPQINTPEEDGLTFFNEHRLGFQQRLARDRGLLPAGTDRKIDQLRDRLDRLLDLSGEQPALVHGDLWSGNTFADTAGRPCLVDPAVHYGLRETDLAMTELF
nr:fructosamine kinase family protein [Nitrospinaceae bacterium]NIR54947.1 fructosamine kinase family protein [Nitrospinaceae bacterium]NIS85365.1 fructosamine kinase family protein [Nitrospinaceae bacterium]NIT82189.1 fructosamine kinase family protein [Nitrospinaceae bacterium]NIU44433.1 fructosamine kinase family protein [Nitrospinaceae bacterium]